MTETWTCPGCDTETCDPVQHVNECELVNGAGEAILPPLMDQARAAFENDDAGELEDSEAEQLAFWAEQLDVDAHVVDVGVAAARAVGITPTTASACYFLGELVVETLDKGAHFVSDAMVARLTNPFPPSLNAELGTSGTIDMAFLEAQEDYPWKVAQGLGILPSHPSAMTTRVLLDRAVNPVAYYLHDLRKTAFTNFVIGVLRGAIRTEQLTVDEKGNIFVSGNQGNFQITIIDHGKAE